MAAEGRKGKTRKTDDALTVQDVRFCKAIHNGKTQYAAYIEAGYPPLESRSSVDMSASRLIKTDKIKSYIHALSQRAASAAMIDIDEVAHLTAATARCDISQVYAEDGSIKPISEWSKELRQAIDQIDRDPKTDKIIRVKIVGRQAALDRLAKWLGMIGDRPIENPATKGKTVIGGEADPRKLAGPDPEAT